MYDELLPPRIESAFRALAYTQSVESGGMTLTPRGPQATPPRVLTSPELALRNTAAEVLRNYINGEIRVTRRRSRPRHRALPSFAPGATPIGDEFGRGDAPTHETPEN
jgi:hypothetical protein